MRWTRGVFRVGHDFRFRARRIETALDVFNVTNHGAFYLLDLGANQTFSPRFGQGRQLQTPRAAAVSARFVF